MSSGVSRAWWLLVAGATLVVAAVASPEVQVGRISLQRETVQGSILLGLTGAMGAALLVLVFFALRGSTVARAGCRWWGLGFSVVMLSAAFVLLSYMEVTALGVMAAFSAFWHWRASKALGA